MGRLAKLFLSNVLLLACAATVVAQTESVSHVRKFQTTDKTDMYEAPDVDAKKIGSIPAGVVLIAFEETARYGGYIKVSYKNKSGWVFKVEVKRYMDVPAPELVCFSNGYKIIGGVYRYFFVLRNDGTRAYFGKVT